jgi:hypothetical protein
VKPHGTHNGRGMIFVTSITEEIHCTEWSAEEIIVRMYYCGSDDVLIINGEEWPSDEFEEVLDRLNSRN